MNRLATLAVVTVSIAGLAACGGDDDSASSSSSKNFCAEFKANVDDAADLSAADIATKLGDLKDSAPGELKDEFETLSKIDISDLTSLDPASAPDLQQAVQTISDYVDSKC